MRDKVVTKATRKQSNGLQYELANNPEILMCSHGLRCINPMNDLSSLIRTVTRIPSSLAFLWISQKRFKKNKASRKKPYLSRTIAREPLSHTSIKRHERLANVSHTQQETRNSSKSQG